MTISDRIFERLTELNMSQKEFSQKTGILQSTVSEWKKKRTNPSSDKILSICSTLGVTPQWLLSGAEPAGRRVNRQDCYIIERTSEAGQLLELYNDMDSRTRARLLGYADAIAALRRENTIAKQKNAAYIP